MSFWKASYETVSFDFFYFTINMIYSVILHCFYSSDTPHNGLL